MKVSWYLIWVWSRWCPQSNRLTRWEYDRELYKKRNEVERLFRSLKGFRRIFSRFNNLDAVFKFFVHFALIADKICR